MIERCTICVGCGNEIGGDLCAHIFMCPAHPAAMLLEACKELVKVMPRNADPARKVKAIIQASAAIVAATRTS